MNKTLVIKMTRCVLIFEEREFLKLLAKDTELWTRAIKRGKAHTRATSTRERAEHKIAKEEGREYE